MARTSSRSRNIRCWSKPCCANRRRASIIAFVWRWSDDASEKGDAARQLGRYFMQPTRLGEEIGEQLKKLFSAKPAASGSVEARLLHAVFGSSTDNVMFPIMSDLELGKIDPSLGYLIQVNMNSFAGSISDPTKNAPDLMGFNIPYPPRPALGTSTVTESELEQWVDNREPRKFFADNAYVPTTTC